MGDEDSENAKTKGFNISSLSGEMSDEEREAADQRLREHIKELAEGSTSAKDALRNIGGLSAMRDAMASMNNMQDAIKASGIDRMR